MTRRFKRQLIARGSSVLLVTTPLVLGIMGAIISHTYLGWEGRAGGILAIGAAFSIGFGVVVGAAWSDYHEVIRYPTLRKGQTSWLRDWIEEPEPVEQFKPKPREGAWKEE